MLLARPNWAVYSRLVGEGDNLVKPLWNQVSKVNNAMMLLCERQCIGIAMVKVGFQ